MGRLDILKSVIQQAPQQVNKAFGPGYDVVQFLNKLIPMAPPESVTNPALGFANQVVAEETLKAARSGAKKMTENLIAQGVPLEKIIETTYGFTGGAGQINPNGMKPAKDSGQRMNTSSGVGIMNTDPIPVNQNNQLNAALAGQAPQQGAPVPQQPLYSMGSAPSIPQQQIQQQPQRLDTLKNNINLMFPFLNPIGAMQIAQKVQNQGYDLNKQTDLKYAKQMKDYENEMPIAKSKKEEIALSGYYDLMKTGAAKTVDQENYISGKYDEVMKDFRVQTQAYSSFRSLYEQSRKEPSGVNDLMMIYDFLKIASPDTVKEGEIKNLQDAVPRLQAAGIAISNFTTGQRLSNKVREQMFRVASTKYNGYTRQANQVTSRFADKISAYGGDPSRALTNYGLPSPKKNNEVNQQPLKVASIRQIGA